ncbi:MAG: DUF1259 domain-containing protein [Bacteroidota bacterium]|nr:DUF1259 domain-containing protein [Bacteroidota bacterium]
MANIQWDKKMKTAIVLICIIIVAISSKTYAQGNSWNEVEKIIGKNGNVQGNVLKITFPRTDLNVKVKDVKIEPALALTPWLAFYKMGDETMIMGDLVLLLDEVPNVIKTVVENGLEITAIHNHILNETPQIIYMHVGGSGEPLELAKKIKSVLNQTKIPIQTAKPVTNKPDYDWTNVQNVIGVKGQINGNVLQFSIPRSEPITENGMEIPTYMGVTTTFNIQLVKEKSIATGDFIVMADEVNSVIKALNENNITVTALHSHMLKESPRLFFLHFWGSDTPMNIAKGLKEGLNKTKSKL